MFFRASHTGDISFNGQSIDVYEGLYADISKSTKPIIEELLEIYPIMLYNGINDIVCHHTGVVAMLNDMQDWSLANEFPTTESQIWTFEGQTAGYLTSLGNLRLLALRNGNHMAPRDAPGAALQMFQDFTGGRL